MVATEIFHRAVKSALMKENWLVTDDPFRLEALKELDDPGALETLAALKGERQIVVTIKSFVGPSLLHDYFGATGRFMSYRLALQMQSAPHTLYLAVPLDTYEEFFDRHLVQLAVREDRLRLLVFSVENEEVVAWIN